MTTELARSATEPNCLSIEALDDEIVTLSRSLTATEYALLVRIREFDERGGWLKWGATGCAEWLHWRCDLSLSAAREKVRVAHSLKCLPRISRAFREGALSYSKARALTRVANPANEAELLEFALTVSAAVVEQRCQQLRNVRPESTAVAARAYRSRCLYASRRADAGRMMLTVELPLEDGEMVLNALDRVVASGIGGRESDGFPGEAADVSTSYGTRQADALVELCQATLCHSGDGSRASSAESLRGGLRGGADGPHCGGADDESRARSVTAEAYQVVIHVDEAALGNSARCGARSDLPVETVRRITCDGSVVPVTESPTGGALDVGRRRRTVPSALRRALLARDRHCRFPGCGHRRFVDAHHVRHWALGGETSIDNLILLCGHHHRLVHEGGFDIYVDNDGRLFFRRPDGRAVPACGYRREDQEDDEVDASAEASSEGSAEQPHIDVGGINPTAAPSG